VRCIAALVAGGKVHLSFCPRNMRGASSGSGTRDAESRGSDKQDGLDFGELDRVSGIRLEIFARRKCIIIK